MSLIEIKGVTKDYRDGKTLVKALRGIDLVFKEGEFAAIAGPSGSGKTTLLNLIGGLDRLSFGSIAIDGREVSTMRRRELTDLRRSDIGFVFQSYNLVPVLTARENVELIMALQGRPVSEYRRRAMQILERVGLKDEGHRRPAALSGGQQQRVAVARAIVSRPKVVLADEPTANLDSAAGANLLDLMLRLNREEGMTFLFSTHDPMVMSYARRLIMLHDGKVASDEIKDP